MMSTEKAREVLGKFGQEHLLQFFDELDAAGKKQLLEQISSIDFEQLDSLTNSLVLSDSHLDIPTNPAPAPVLPARPADQATAEKYQQARLRGQEVLSAGKVAAVVVAGGAGTRLGISGPKGCVQVTPVKKKSLFQVFAEQILAASRKYQSAIPWYIMTSPQNDAETRLFFRKHDFFGLNEKDIFFFTQGQMPVVDKDTGKILLADKDAIAFSPNGHGGCISAMRDNGVLEDMAHRGIEYISYFQVDDPIIKCIDPLFIGLAVQENADIATKVIPKRDPAEKLGNICLVDGKVMIIEYSDLPETLARKVKDDGKLLFAFGSIATHIFKRNFLERITEGGKCQLPFHRALKKVPYINEKGEKVIPTEPNAVKFEMFIFDAMPLADKVVVFETERSEEFSPLKEASGENSMDTCIRDQIRRWARWLEQVGIAVPRDAWGEPAAVIEISPLLANEPEDLVGRVPTDLKIKPGDKIYLE